MPKFYHSKKSYMECFRIKLLHKNEFKNSLILYKVKKCIYLQNKSFVKKKKKTTNKAVELLQTKKATAGA